MIRLRFTSVAAVFLVWACSSTESTPGTSSSGGTDGGTTNEGGSSGTPAPGDICTVTRSYVIDCAGESELDCGKDKYAAWCTEKDQKTNSEAFRRAELKCLPTVGCDPNERRDCEYKSYAGEKPTDAQKALVEAYCLKCEPADTAGCATRAVTYDPAAGVASVTDLFIAAWELADPIVDQIREKCTGTALPDGPDPCPKRFGECAADPYLDAIPDCPP